MSDHMITIQYMYSFQNHVGEAMEDYKLSINISQDIELGITHYNKMTTFDNVRNHRWLWLSIYGIAHVCSVKGSGGNIDKDNYSTDTDSN